MRPLDMTRACRDAGRALGIGLGAAFLVAVVTASRHATAERYWASGYVRLIADGLWQRFDRLARVLNPAVHTLAEVLKNAGYATAAFTGGGHVHRSRGFDQGFDRFKHGKQLERALDWIGRHRGRKWFLFFHTYEIHDPYV